MSRIDELIAQHCPDGVDFRVLGEITTRAQNIRWAKASEEEFQYIDLSSVDRVTRRIGETTTISSSNAPSRAQQIVHEGDVIFATTRPAQMRWCLIRAEYDGQIASTGFCVLRPDTSAVNASYLTHILGADRFQRHIEANQIQGNYPSIPDARVREYRVPVPPLAVQREIVRILDTFTQLEAELEAELEARKQQYEHLQRKLLTFSPETARWTTLGEIGHVSMCKRVFKQETTSEGDIPFFKIGTFGGEADAYISRELYEEYKERFSFPRQGDVLISAAGTIGRTVIYDGTPSYFQDSNIVWVAHDESIVLNGYLRYWYDIVNWSTDGGTIRRLYNENIRRTPIAVPPIEEQRRIVTILDKFDALVNDLSVGLPAELAARRQQYEYYRDRLLTFKELEVAA
jgi:type I restriction enzyme S subunit